MGDGGEIDHFRPLHARDHDFSHLKNDYGNLYWTCGQCNLEKGNLWPSDLEHAEGFRFLNPCVEDHDDHWVTHADGTVTAKPNIGRFTIRFIRLDRQRLNEVYKDAVLASAASIIVAHNHPSGDPTPSAEDVAVTKRLIQSGEIMGIDLLDHIVLGDGTFVGLKDRGLN